MRDALGGDMKKVFNLLSVLALAFFLVVALFASANLLYVAPVSASSVSGTSTVVPLVSGNGVTQTVNGGVYNVTNYGTGDCYIYSNFANAGAGQSLTVTFQHAGVAGQWVTYGAVEVVTSTQTFTNINPLYGAYMRAYANLLTTAYPVTFTVNCVVKNRLNN
jgi:hypothetical protein